MTLSQMYEQIGGDYADVTARLMTESIVRKFLKKFAADLEAQKLKQALETGDEQSAFRSAHTLKGTALNLGLTNLSDIAVELTESLRYGKTDATDGLFEKFYNEYERTISLIQQLDE